MAKESYYFSHDYNARNDEKVLELRSCYGAEGYGVFWMLVETMAENQNGVVKASLIGGLSLGYGVSKDKLKLIIDCCISVGLVHEKDGYYFSNRLLQYKTFRKNQAEFGKIGAEKRWGSHRQPNSTPNAKERKGKEIKEIEGDFFVFFSDDSKQPLGSSQLVRFKNEDIKPEEILKGKIY